MCPTKLKLRLRLCCDNLSGFLTPSCISLLLGPLKSRLLDIFSQPLLNLNSTQPYITGVGFDMKMTLHHHHHPPTTTHHRELNVSNISAVTNPILTKLSRWVSGINNNKNSQQQQQQHQQKQQQQQQNIFQL